MFFSVRELELRKAHFDVAYPPGEIEFHEQKLRQVSPLEAEGSVELLGNTLGEIRVRGHLRVTMEARVRPVPGTGSYSAGSDFDLFYRPEPEPRPAR